MENRYRTGQVVTMLGLKNKMQLKRWEDRKQGDFRKPKRIARSNHRIYTDADVEWIRNWMDRIIDPNEPDETSTTADHDRRSTDAASRAS